MPDFPKVGGATAAEVAAAILIDPGTDKIDGSQVDASIASRSTLTQAQVLNDATPFAGGSVATIKGKTDLIPADIATQLDTNVPAIKGKTDIIGGSVALETGGNVAAVKARTDKAPAFVTPTESSITMDGTEKTLFEITDIKSAEVEAWVDLTPMAGGDTIVVRYSRKVKAAGTYAKYAEETYTGAQSLPLLKLTGFKIYRDTKVTAQQTAGTNRTLDVQVIRAVEA